MNRTTAVALATAVIVAPGVVLAPTASAGSAPADDTLHLQAHLSPVPFSKVTGSGTATVTLKGNQATVALKARGLLAGAPHAQHFHIAAKGQCPPASAARTVNGMKSVFTTDGAPFYGAIGTSLTTTGDTGPDSGLAVDRFPVGSKIDYHRTITVTPEAAKSLRDGTAVVVVHGIDVNGNGKYDDVLGPSDLDPKLPAEATNPALCGSLATTAQGAVEGGMGGSHAQEGSTLAGTAGAALLAAGGALYLRRRAQKTG
ncbi:hypothetical protein C0Q64_11965 [Streptomyces albidoflavus]|uniref:hypothetical protein n=1 Tax=Streptomyces albidoflavus TaxID=1886 RepID=UPI00101E614A|nr:hypothetical protein [Streptomyces albidoflavus]RZE02402.1 hypothetical protein C0Q64_11965 [Streptomyces albidoflavus]RZE02971.1 hypothetical protein C0Q65_12290 [Streptomyces albidoflavus]